MPSKRREKANTVKLSIWKLRENLFAEDVRRRIPKPFTAYIRILCERRSFDGSFHWGIRMASYRTGKPASQDRFTVVNLFLIFQESSNTDLVASGTQQTPNRESRVLAP